MRISRLIAVVGLPVLLAVAAGSVITAAAKSPAASHAAVKNVSAVVETALEPALPVAKVEAPKTAASPAKAEPADADVENANAAEAQSETAPAGDGHTDELPGPTTESNVDHQFEGNE